MDYLQFEKAVLENNPLLQENALKVDKKKLALKKLQMDALLPKFQLDMGVGPAPGLITTSDTNYLHDRGLSGIDSSRWVQKTSRDFDFHNWGPFFGMEMGVVQPLNVSRYRAGKNAAKLEIIITEQEHYKEKMQSSLDAQEIYYGYLYAEKVLGEVLQAEKDLNKAEDKLEELLDEESESISQSDLLKLKASRYDLVKGKNEASKGLSRAQLGARFYLFLSDSLQFRPADSLLTATSLHLPPKDTLKLLTVKHHPDLKRLTNGLEARREMMKVAMGEMGPDIFLFGSFKYSKAWSAERKSGESDVFASDPLNEIDGAAGLGLRLKLNFWSKIQSYKKHKLELRQLERTEIYAVRGLLLKLEEAYLNFEEALSNMDAAEKSLKAAEAWLKGAAMDYDLDPTTAPKLISPYRTALSARADYYKAVFDYNMAVGKVIFSMGWTLSDYLSNVNH